MVHVLSLSLVMLSACELMLSGVLLLFEIGSRKDPTGIC